MLAMFCCETNLLNNGSHSITIAYGEPYGSRGIMMAFRWRLAVILTLLMVVTPMSPLMNVSSVGASPEQTGTAAPLDVWRMATGLLSEPSIAGDSDGNFHILWIENQSKAMYAKIDSDGSLVNGPAQIVDAGSNIKWSPRLVIDESDILHMLWIRYTTSNDCLFYYASNPTTDADQTDGYYSPSESAGNNVVCKTNFIIENIANPNLAVDSQGAAHIV